MHLIPSETTHRRCIGSPDVRTNIDQQLAPVLAVAERNRRKIEDLVQKRQLAQFALDAIENDRTSLERRRQRLAKEVESNAAAWTTALNEARVELDALTADAVLGLIDELREATTTEAQLRRRIDGINRDTRDHAARVDAVAERIGLPASDTSTRLHTLRDRLAEARSSARVLETLDHESERRRLEIEEAEAKLHTAEDALAPLMMETAATDRDVLLAVIEQSRAKRSVTSELKETEQRVVADGDGLALDDLIDAVTASDPNQLSGRVDILNAQLGQLNSQVGDAATAHGDARRAFASLETNTASAADAAADAAQARSELDVLAEHYILKRAQAVTLKWVIERYRKRHHDPLLLRAAELFSILTLGRYATLQVDMEESTPTLKGALGDGRTLVDVDAMSEGTTDQLFLALGLAALEQSVIAGVNLPFLADDLFVNFDDKRAEAGFRVLAEIARSTQVLFFTHHRHLAGIARRVMGAEHYSECTLT